MCVCVCMFSLRFFGLMVKVEPSDVDSFTIKKRIASNMIESFLIMTCSACLPAC